ncbi:MAG: HAMP domain-containing sensor histidine kinase [Chloroflexota bacterium]
MSVRVRLTVWSAALAAILLCVVSGSAYALHIRSQYEDLDRSPVITAEHLQEELQSAGSASDPARFESSGPSILTQLYGADLSPVNASAANPSPPLGPLEVLTQDAGPAYDRVLRLLPGGEASEIGAFATTADDVTGDRLRSYALPVGPDGQNGYVLAWASLEQLDDSRQFLRLLLLAVVAGGTAIVAVGSFIVADRALRPVSVMTQTARAIAASRGFARRLEDTGGTDELARLARTFNEMLASLEESYRLQQRFVADAAHELRAPLTAILGNLDLLSRTPEMTAEERAEALEYADSEARRLSRIVSELLTLARADAGQTLERGPVELDRILLDALTDVRSSAQGRVIELRNFAPAVVRGDADRLKQLLVNLLDNAVKYSPPVSPITVDLTTSNGEAALIVSDGGPGIEPEDLPHVFERFYRADLGRSRDPGGSGLGLAIARWIVEQHEGTITIDSTAGLGTTVAVRLPIEGAANSRRTNDSASADTSAPRTSA